MTTPTSPHDADLVDLTRPTRPARFRLDGDIFTFARKVPVARFAKLTNFQRTFGGFAESGDLDPFWDFLRQIMPADDVTTLVQRADDITNPIDHNDLLAIVNHMLEVWGMRPTQPPSDSSSSSDGGTPGTTSTDGPPAEDSTPANSALTGGSTSPTDTYSSPANQIVTTS